MSAMLLPFQKLAKRFGGVQIGVKKTRLRQICSRVTRPGETTTSGPKAEPQNGRGHSRFPGGKSPEQNTFTSAKTTSLLGMRKITEFPDTHCLKLAWN